jgi:hypothetical protein
MTCFVDGFHDALAESVGGMEHGVAVAVRQAVKGVNPSGYEFFHDVIGIGLGLKKRRQVLVAVKAIGGDGAYPVIGLGDYRITGFMDQGVRIFHGVDDPSAGNRNSGLPKLDLHAGFTSNEINFGAANTKYIKIVPETRLSAQPVFIEGIQTIDFAVAVGKKAASPHQRIIVVHIIDPIILGQCGLNFRRQVVVWFVTNT